MKIYDMEIGKSRLPVLICREEKEDLEEKYDTPSKIAGLFTLAFQLHKKAEEHIYMAAFDSKQHLLGIFEVAKGTVNTCICSTREIFMRALFVGAVNIVIVHNHPSGCSGPSDADLEMYAKIKNAGSLLNVELIDFIIIGNNEYYSMEEN